MAGPRIALVTSPKVLSGQSGALFGLTPFLLFSLFFLIIPTIFLLANAFVGPDGKFTFDNIAALYTNTQVRNSFILSFQLSLISALLGALCGFAIAYAIVFGGLPSWVRSSVLTFSGVASQFAGIPLAFAFVATLGRTGIGTSILRDYLGVNLYGMRFNLISLSGLIIVYLYFQISLMVLVITPALDGLRREWGEACSALGGSPAQYWRYIALPILWPSILGATLLLFANAFGAVATAYALTGSTLTIAPIMLMAQVRGDVLHNPGLGYAIAFGMVMITSVTAGGYLWLRARSERWAR